MLCAIGLPCDASNALDVILDALDQAIQPAGQDERPPVTKAFWWELEPWGRCNPLPWEEQPAAEQPAMERPGVRRPPPRSCSTMVLAPGKALDGASSTCRHSSREEW